MIETLVEGDDGDEKKRRAATPDDFEHYLATMRHYSDLIFKTRVAIISACVLIFSFIAAFKSDSLTGFADQPHAKFAAAAAVGIALMSFMENNYMKQYCKTIISGATFEVRVKRGGFFVLSNIAWRRYLLFYYFADAALAYLAINKVVWDRQCYKFWLGDWSLNECNLVGVLLIVAFAIFGWGYIVMWGDSRRFKRDIRIVRKQWHQQVVEHDKNLLELHGDHPKEEIKLWWFLPRRLRRKFW